MVVRRKENNMLDDGIDMEAMRIYEMTEKANELGFEDLDEYLIYLENERAEHGTYQKELL